MQPPPGISQGIPLAPLTTLGLGGPARYFLKARDDAALMAGLRWAATAGVPALILGGGSNVIVADDGFDGLVVHVATRGVRSGADGEAPLIEAAAGEPWDALVARAVAAGLAGVECLSGIPGLVGATPIQNVGAYGQEVAETIRGVRAYDRRHDRIVELDGAACAFGYRDSAFKHEPARWAVLGVMFALRANGAPALRYRELAEALSAARDAAQAQVQGPPSLSEVRDAVLALRRRKSMVLEPTGPGSAPDPNRRSVGSFFVNPVLSAAEADAVVARALAAGVVRDAGEIPRFPAGEGGGIKLPAAWLIEHAGFPKGTRRGAVGLSSNHALALVHHGGGTTGQLLAFADDIRAAVAGRFGVTLAREPVLVG